MPNYYEPHDHITDPYPTLGEYKGKLALFWGWNIDREQPRYYRDVDVSPISIEKELVRDFIGMRIMDWKGNIGVLPRPMYGAGWIDTTSWTKKREYKDIPKPRRRKSRTLGRPYDWVWTPDFMGGWEGRWVRTNE